MNDLTINAMPTKELFIDMLTRDIALIPAIIDLVDNSTDGARHLRKEKSYDGLHVGLDVSSDQFKIWDNCGGMTIETAKSQAFRFGRPADADTVKHSVGEFGVGMKRALFKLGDHFVVESATKNCRFKVPVTVSKWAKDRDLNWTFSLADVEEGITVPEDDCGVTITVTELRPDVKAEFSSEKILTALKIEMKSRLAYFIEKGLKITLNGIPIDANPVEMLTSDGLAPAFSRFRIPSQGPKPVSVSLFCGLGKEASKADAGWSVYCNGRLILAGDKSGTTGWGEKSEEIKTPHFHGQFNRLRGYAYFDCDSQGRLPWNTTKTGVNVDSGVWRATRLEMIKLMRPVVQFLNKLKEEKEGKWEDSDPGPLERLVEKATAAPLDPANSRKAFEMPKVKLRTNSGPQTQKVQFERPKAQVDKAKKVLGATSYAEVGQKTFDYFFNAECKE